MNRGRERELDRLLDEGAGHEIQFAGDPINETLQSFWRSSLRQGSWPA